MSPSTLQECDLGDVVNMYASSLSSLHRIEGKQHVLVQCRNAYGATTVYGIAVGSYANGRDRVRLMPIQS